jgi:hypothetical protein
MRRIAFIAFLLLTSPLVRAGDGATGFRFGILKAEADGSYVLQTETTRIPRRFKDTGFRFGIAFQNPRRQEIVWHEIVQLPEKPGKATGNMRRAGAATLETKPQRSAQASVVDDFWFDKGDPLGKHRMELIVNGKSVYAVDFEVVE